MEKQRVTTSLSDLERAFAESRQRLDIVTALMRGWIWETDAEHRFSYMSDSVERFAGRPPEWHYGRTREELGNVPANEEERRAYQHRLDSRAQLGPSDFQRMQEGQPIWMRTIGVPRFDAAGAFLGYCGIAFEVGDEIAARESAAAAQASLARHADLLAATIRHFPYGLCVFDAKSRLVLVNPTFYEITGLPPAQFPVGCHADEILQQWIAARTFTNADESEIRDSHQRLSRSTDGVTLQRLARDGRAIEIRGGMLPDGGFIKTYCDVTEQLEQRRSKLTNEVSAELGSELNAEIRRHLGRAQIVLDQLIAGDPTEAQLQALEVLRESGRSLLSNIAMLDAIRSLNAKAVARRA